MQSCAVDPGSVNTDIYRSVAMGRGVFKAVREFFCSPPAQGAAAVVHAATGVHLQFFLENPPPPPPPQICR